MKESVKVTVRLPPLLRAEAGGAASVEIEVEGDEPSVRRLLASLDAAYPGVGRRVTDERGDVRRHVNVFVGADNIRDLAGDETVLTATSEVTILPAISGG